MSINTYIRQGIEKGANAEARFTFEDTNVVLIVNPDGTLSLHKAKADGAPAKAEVGKGKWHVEAVADGSKDPHLRGLFGTAKGSVFELAAWYHNDEGDCYYSAVIRPRLVRNGFLPQPK